MRTATIRLCGVLLAVAAIAALFSCSEGGGAPAYVKDVVAYREGTGAMVVYFVMSDDAGRETQGDGTVALQVYATAIDEKTFKPYDRLLWTLTEKRVEKSDFHTTQVGQGAFAHKRLICSLGRISYSRFSSQPSKMEISGKVKIVFRTTSGRELFGEGSVLF